MEDKVANPMYQMPSLPGVFHVPNHLDQNIIRHLYGDMVIEFRNSDKDLVYEELRALISNRSTPIYLICDGNPDSFFCNVQIFYSSDVDYANALLIKSR